MTLSQWALLGFATWTLLLLVSTIGVHRVSAVLLKRARANDFNAAVPHGSEWYQRCMRAHMNCVENLPVFASLVLLGSAVAVPGQLFQLASLLVLPARVLQSVAHVSSGRNRAVLARFAFYTVQMCCFALLAGLLVAHGLNSK